ncbi:Zn-dependent metalloprotease [Kutzneria viridogrisea]|uniref:Zn-dependent metalloprotease n=1 Tax=Kutzneria viridogrisea TaxID=47990 RepID=A0ABR6BY13_9PSEU|nr:Zn-dependent metalloprotease [Kutzneria viridogrisea]
MAFGEGVTTLDITGHELTHGVTQHVNGLKGGYAQAINEGMSDVFGKFIAIKANDPNATGANRWLLGVGSSIGQVRDMKNPANSGEGPARTGSTASTGSARTVTSTSTPEWSARWTT